MRLGLAYSLVLFMVGASTFTGARSSSALQLAAAADNGYARQVAKGVERLQAWYDPHTGLWKSTGWWNSANALTALVDFMRVKPSPQYLPVIARTYSVNLPGGFLNQYYDDEGWWALAWIDAYDLTGDAKYLATAQDIFSDMTGGWDNTTCRGGLWWRKKRDYKNAIANELFLSVAAHLANRVTNPAQKSQDAAWAWREWNWFAQSGMIEGDHLISDGLTAGCEDNHRRKWSYNQGVILGGLAELSRLKNRISDLRQAKKIADAAIVKLSDSHGILHDACEPRCGGDGSQFKGIFLRNLALLNRYRPEERYRRFILSNATSILVNNQDPDHTYGLVWSGPPGKANASTQSSALDALIAALPFQAPVHR